MLRTAWSGSSIAVALTFALGPGLAHAAVRSIRFERSVVNLESFSGALWRIHGKSVLRAPAPDSGIWFGEIYRQLPTDAPTSREHNVAFAVRMEGGVATGAWADANLNGDLTDDPSPSLSAYPDDPASRSFLVPLRWTASSDHGPTPIERLVRVVIESPPADDQPPGYRLQDVYGMLGRVEIDGRPRTALLFDANHDGLYTKGHGDGVFFDLDGDRHFVIDPLAPDFGPFAIPFSILHTSMQVDSVSRDGSQIVLRELGPAHEALTPQRGRMAPDFTFVDMEGKLQRLSAHRGRPTVVYFWASWCANCRGQADGLRTLRNRADGSTWDLLGIGLDTDRADAGRFRSDFSETWPTSFSGGYTSEDPVARLYHEDTVGVFYVVAPNGLLLDKVFDVDALAAALERARTMASPASAAGDHGEGSTRH